MKLILFKHPTYAELNVYVNPEKVSMLKPLVSGDTVVGTEIYFIGETEPLHVGTEMGEVARRLVHDHYP